MTDCREVGYRLSLIEGAEEVEDIWRRLDSCFNPPISVLVEDLSAYGKKLADCATTVACYVEGRLAGAVSFYANDAESGLAYVAEIATVSCFRGMHVGSALLEAAFRASRDAGMREMRLEVFKQNASALAFYERKGFRAIEDRGEGILMARAL